MQAIHLQQSDELPLLHIHNRRASAVIALQGAQVLRYQRHDSHHPLIWLSDLAAYKQGQSIRGGIPVCWPWFGDLARNPEHIRRQFPLDNAPAHGLVRGQTWLLEAIGEDNTQTVVTLRCPTAEIGLAHIGLQLNIVIGDSLQLSLSTTNHGNSEFHFTQALHTYFAVSDIHTTSINGLENTRYIETLENWIEKKQDGAVTFAGETDRIYLDIPSSVEIVDPAWQRRITLHAEGSRSAVVWNPWIEKSKRLGQFGMDAWADMLCVETANVLVDAQAIATSRTQTLGLRLSTTEG